MKNRDAERSREISADSFEVRIVKEDDKTFKLEVPQRLIEGTNKILSVILYRSRRGASTL